MVLSNLCNVNAFWSKQHAVGTPRSAPAVAAKGEAMAEGPTVAELGPGVEVPTGGVGPWRTGGLKE